MKKTIGKRILGVATALMMATLCIVPPNGMGVKAAGGNDVVESLDQDPYNGGGKKSTTQTVLLAGEGNSLNPNGSTLDAVKANYKDEFLLGIAGDFSVFLKGNLEVTNSDAEGRVAVGGDIIPSTYWENYTIGAGDFWTHVPLDDLLVDRKGAATVILGGELQGKLNDTYYDIPYASQGGITDTLSPDGTYDSTGDNQTSWRLKYEGNNGDRDNHGNTVQTPTKKSTKILVLNDSAPASVEKNKTQIPSHEDSANATGNWQKIDQSQTYVTTLLNFNTEFNKLKEISQELSMNLDDTKITVSKAEDGRDIITFTYLGDEKEKDCVYFNLSADDFEAFQNAIYIKFENIPKYPNGGLKFIGNDGQEVTWEYCYIIVNVDAATEADGKIHLVNNESTDYNNVTKGQKFTTINGKPISRENPSVTDVGWNNHPGVASLMYNFYTAGTKTIVLGNNFQGTIFAPEAHVTDEFTLMVGPNYPYGDGGKDGKMGEPAYKELDAQYANYRGHLSGALIANDFKGATEFGYRPFSAPAAILTNSAEDEIEITKIWNDNNNAAKARPSSVTVTVTGTPEKGAPADVPTITKDIVLSGSTWSKTIKLVGVVDKTADDELPMYYYYEYEDNGNILMATYEYTYTVSEPKVPTGYTSKVDGYTITNTYVAEDDDPNSSEDQGGTGSTDGNGSTGGGDQTGGTGQTTTGNQTGVTNQTTGNQTGSNSQTTTGNQTSVKTGDDMNTGVWLVAILALVASACIIVMKKKEER